jgi:hypothetical protein
LDWFWRGWFYGTEAVDISIENVAWYKMDNRTPSQKAAEAKKVADLEETYVSRSKNMTAIKETYVEADPATKDFYATYNPFQVTPSEEESYKKFMAGLSTKEKELLNSNLNFYEVKFRNEGGLVMPIILEWQFADGTSELEKIPVEIWRKNETEVSKVFAKQKEVKRLVLDPNRETADIDESSNYWPREMMPSRFEMYKRSGGVRGAASGSNPMKEAKKK